jgi:hypothetical protein
MKMEITGDGANIWPLRWSFHRNVHWNRKMRMSGHGGKVSSCPHQSVSSRIQSILKRHPGEEGDDIEAD